MAPCGRTDLAASPVGPARAHGTMARAAPLPRSTMNMPAATVSLGSLVIRTIDVARALSFYRALGLDFTEEQHGAGPRHFCCDLGGMILEIYPGKPGSAPERTRAGATMIGFVVTSI